MGRTYTDPYLNLGGFKDGSSRLSKTHSDWLCAFLGPIDHKVKHREGHFPMLFFALLPKSVLMVKADLLTADSFGALPR